MGKTLKVFGWIFLVIGILGFFSNPIVGSGAWFHADFNHNLVHLLTGLIMLWVAYKAMDRARTTLKTFGWIYLIIAILGFFLVSGTGTLLGLVEINGTDNWLHLVLAVIFFWAVRRDGRGAGMAAMPASAPESEPAEPMGSEEQSGGNM